jgi:hypothetical protein
MPQLLGNRVSYVQFKLGNRTDLAQPLSITPGGITTLAVNAPGTLYQVEDQVEIIQANAYNGFAAVTSVSQAGGITGLQLVDDGFGFTTTSALPLVGGNGSGGKVNITAAAQTGPSRIDLWLRDAYINLGMSTPFPDSEFSIQDLYTVQGVDNLNYPDTVRAIKCLTLYRPDGTVLTMETKDVQYIRRMNSQNQGAPSIWCDFAQSILLRPVPDGNGPYQAVMDVWLKPVILNPIETTPILLPDDWLEVLDYMAAARGHTELQEEDKARAIQSLLYGSVDPQTGKYTPGMVQNLQTRMQATSPYINFGVQPKGATQTYTRRS